MAAEYLKTHQSNDDWRKVTTGFERQWNFPNCVGALVMENTAMYRDKLGLLRHKYNLVLGKHVNYLEKKS